MQSLRRVAGIGRRMVGQAITSGERPSAAMLHDLAELDGRFNEPWTVLEGDAASAGHFPPELRDALVGGNVAYLGNTRRQRDQIMNQLAQWGSSDVGRKAGCRRRIRD